MGTGGMVPTVPYTYRPRPVAQVSFAAGEAVAQTKNGTREASFAAPDKSASFAIAALAAHKTPTPPPALSAGNTLNPGPASAPTNPRRVSAPIMWSARTDGSILTPVL